MMRPTPSRLTPLATKSSGKTPHDTPSFRLLTSPACDAEKSVLFRQLVSAKTWAVDGLSIGWARADELRQAIVACRKAGKKTFAYMEDGTALDYFVALGCDEIIMPPAGTLMLVGLRAEVTFYKGLLDKLGVKADFMQMGDFKGAAEPFLREDMSPENRKQLEAPVDRGRDGLLARRRVPGRAARRSEACTESSAQ